MVIGRLEFESPNHAWSLQGLIEGANILIQGDNQYAGSGASDNNDTYNFKAGFCPGGWQGTITGTSRNGESVAMILTPGTVQLFSCSPFIVQWRAFAIWSTPPNEFIVIHLTKFT